MAVRRYDDVAVGGHGADRWDRRTSPGSVAPETAWRSAWEMPLISEYRDADELRYYQPENVVLMRRDATLCTVLDMGRVQSAQARALRRAVERQFGRIDDPEVTDD